MRVCQYHQQTKPREEGTGSYSHVCPSPSVTAPVNLPPLLAVIASGVGHFHTARASRLTSHGCTTRKAEKTAWAHRVFYAPLGADQHSFFKTRNWVGVSVCSPPPCGLEHVHNKLNHLFLFLRFRGRPRCPGVVGAWSGRHPGEALSREGSLGSAEERSSCGGASGELQDSTRTPGENFWEGPRSQRRGFHGNQKNMQKKIHLRREEGRRAQKQGNIEKCHKI